MARFKPTHTCSDADWDSYLDAKYRHANPDDAWEQDQKVCPYCGDEPKATDSDRCTSCLEIQVEKAEDALPYNPITSMLKLDPRVVAIITGKKGAP